MTLRPQAIMTMIGWLQRGRTVDIRMGLDFPVAEFLDNLRTNIPNLHVTPGAGVAWVAKVKKVKL